MRLSVEENRQKENSKRVVRSVRRYSYDRGMVFESSSELMYTDSCDSTDLTSAELHDSSSQVLAGSRSVKSGRSRRTHGRRRTSSPSNEQVSGSNQKTLAIRRPILPRDVSPDSSGTSGGVVENLDEVDSDNDPTYVPSEESADEMVPQGGMWIKCVSDLPYLFSGGSAYALLMNCFRLTSPAPILLTVRSCQSQPQRCRW